MNIADSSTMCLILKRITDPWENRSGTIRPERFPWGSVSKLQEFELRKSSDEFSIHQPLPNELPQTKFIRS